MQSFDPNRDARHGDRDESNRGNNEKRRREVEKKSQAEESDHQRHIDDRRNPVFGAIDATLKAEQQRTKIGIHGSPPKKSWETILHAADSTTCRFWTTTGNSGSAFELRTSVRRRNWRTAGRVFVELVAQRADRNSENISGVRAIPQTVLERLEDEVSLDFGHHAADQITGDLLGCHGGMGGEVGAASLVKPRAVGRKYPVNANFEPGRKQDGPMQGVFQFAHVARPAVRIKRASGLDRERTQRKVVGL